MCDSREQVWSLPRFLFRAVPLTIACGIAWKLTFHQNAALTVAITKFLHRLVGFPAPYMFCDTTKLFWHGALFPPVVGLTLASYWIRWPDRILRTLVGYLAHVCLTAIAVTINESPYLMQTELLNPVTSTLVNANYLMFGVVIWLLAAGPWYLRLDRLTTSAPNVRSIRRAWAVVRHGWATRLIVLVLAVSLVIPLFALTGTPAGMSTRAELARAMRAVPYFPHPSDAEVDGEAGEHVRREDAAAKAILAVEAVLKADERAGVKSAAIKHLLGHMLIALRPEDTLRRTQFRAQASAWLREARSARGR